MGQAKQPLQMSFFPLRQSVSISSMLILSLKVCGKGYINKITEWKKQQYEIIIYFFKLPSPEFAIERVKLRVSQGGHNIPEQVIQRRFERSRHNFNTFYKQLADSWIVFDTSGNLPIILDESE